MKNGACGCERPEYGDIAGAVCAGFGFGDADLHIRTGYEGREFFERFEAGGGSLFLPGFFELPR